MSDPWGGNQQPYYGYGDRREGYGQQPPAQQGSPPRHVQGGSYGNQPSAAAVSSLLGLISGTQTAQQGPSDYISLQPQQIAPIDQDPAILQQLLSSMNSEKQRLESQLVHAQQTSNVPPPYTDSRRARDPFPPRNPFPPQQQPHGILGGAPHSRPPPRQSRPRYEPRRRNSPPRGPPIRRHASPPRSRHRSRSPHKPTKEDAYVCTVRNGSVPFCTVNRTPAEIMRRYGKNMVIPGDLTKLSANWSAGDVVPLTNHVVFDSAVVFSDDVGIDDDTSDHVVKIVPVSGASDPTKQVVFSEVRLLVTKSVNGLAALPSVPVTGTLIDAGIEAGARAGMDLKAATWVHVMDLEYKREDDRVVKVSYLMPCVIPLDKEVFARMWAERQVIRLHDALHVEQLDGDVKDTHVPDADTLLPKAPSTPGVIVTLHRHRPTTKEEAAAKVPVRPMDISLDGLLDYRPSDTAEDTIELGLFAECLAEYLMYYYSRELFDGLMRRINVDKGKKRVREGKTERIVDNALLNAGRFFDKRDIGYMRLDDVVTVLYSIDKGLTGREIAQLVDPFSDDTSKSKRRFFYTKAAVREEVLEAEEPESPTGDSVAVVVPAEGE